MATWFRSFAGETTTTPPADTTKRGDAGATWTVESDGNALDNRVIYNDRASQNTWKILSFDGAGSPGGVVEALILTRFDGTTGSPRTGVIIHGAGSDDNGTLNGYMAYLDRSATQGRLRLARWDSSSLTALANATSFSFNGGNDLFYIRIQHNGTAIRAKWWRAQDNEPGSWTLSSNDTTYSSGWIAYANTQVNTSQAIRLDAIGVGTGGDPAPMILPAITPAPTAVDDEQIDIAFNTIPHADAQYDLRWSTDDATWTTISGVSTPYQHTNLTPSTTYYYQARMRLGAFTGDWSANASATTTGDGPPTVDLEAESGLILGMEADLAIGHTVDASPGLILGIEGDLQIGRSLETDTGLVFGIEADLQVLPPGKDVSSGPGLILGVEGELAIGHAIEADAGLVLGVEGDLAIGHALEVTTGLVFGIEADLEIVPETPEMEASAGLVLGIEADLQVNPRLEADAGLVFGIEADLAIEHVVTAAAIFELTATLAIAQDHILTGRAILELVSHEGYIGPGSGLQTGPPAPLDRMLREGDTFPVFYRWAGLEGLSGIAHVMARTVRSDRDRQILRVQNIFPDDPALDRPLARGETPSVRPAENTIIRTIKRQRRREREGDG